MACWQPGACGAGATRRCAAVGHDGTGADRATARVTLPRLCSTPRRAVATQASGAEATRTGASETVVASLLAVWAWLEPAGPRAGPGALSTDAHRADSLAGGAGCGHHVSRSSSTAGRPGWSRGRQRDAADASRTHWHGTGRPGTR